MSRGTVLLLLAAFALLTVAIAPLVGMQWIGPGALWGAVEDYGQVHIFWKIRIPRVLMALLAGLPVASQLGRPAMLQRS